MKNVSRAGRKAQIENVLETTVGAVTTYKLARMVGMSPSPHFRGIVYELYQEGRINGGYTVLRNGKMAFYWSSKFVPSQLTLDL